MPRKLAPTLLIVGGGFAGRSALRYFIASITDAHVILIDEKPFFEFTPAVLRCIVYPGHIRHITFGQHSDPDFSYLQGKVTHMTHREATVSRRNGNRVTVFSVPFDFCIWATGVDYAQPIRTHTLRGNPTVLTRRGEFGYFRHRIISSTEILVLGAGPIGVELSAEITGLRDQESARLRVTLAASPRGVLSRFPKRAGMYASAWLTKRGVRILKSHMKKGMRLPGGRFQYTDPSDPSVIVTPDLVLDCTGAKNNGATSALVSGGLCDDSLLQRDGSLLVLDTLQLPETPHVFVAGDAHRVVGELELGRLACEKTAYAAEEAGKLAAKNVAMLMRGDSLLGGRPRQLHRYPTDAFPTGMFPRLVVISLYKYNGILCLGPVVVTGLLAAVVKISIEVFGVASAEQESAFSVIFRTLEWLSYIVATLFQLIGKVFQQRRRA